MRVTNQMLVSSFLQNVNGALARVERRQNELSSGKMLQRPSDDPVGVARALTLRETLAQTEQYQRNIDSAKSFLSTTETSMRSIVDLLQRARELAVQGGTDTLDASQRDMIGKEAEELLRQGVQEGNGKLQNYYLFGGTNQAAAPYTLVEGATMSVTPPVNPGNVTREIGVGQQMVVNVPGDAVLPTAFDALCALRNAAKNGTSTQVRDSIDQLDAALTTVLSGMAEVGAKMNRIEAAQQRSIDLQTNFQQLLSQVEDADLADVITNLSAQQAGYQAALAMGAKILQPSLIDFLR